MFNSTRYFSLAVFSLASVIVSCSDGQVNTLADLSQKSRAPNEQQTVVVSEKSSRNSDDVSTGRSTELREMNQPDVDLAKLSEGGSLSVASLEQARRGGMTDEKIIAEASRLALSFEVESLAALGLAKFVLKQYGVGDVDGIRAMGLASVDRARAAGLNDNEIKTYAKLQDIRFGERALVSLGLSKFVLSSYGVGDVDGIKAMGLASVDRARAAGVSDNDIRSYAKLQDIRFGERALVSLGLSKFVLSSYGVGDVDGIRAMGLASVDRARAAGVSDNDIRSYAKLQDIRFGEKALVSLGLSKFVLSSYGTGMVDGVTAMGLASVDRARAAGLSDSEIKIYAKLQNIFFGERALVSLG